MAEDKERNNWVMAEENDLKLFFQWKVSAFIPYLSGEHAGEVESIREEFAIQSVSKAAERDFSEYRCVPEYLLDMGWIVIVENAARENRNFLTRENGNDPLPADSFDQLLKSEGRISLIEKKILQWIWKGAKLLEKIAAEQDDFDAGDWQKEAALCRKLLGENYQYQWEDIDELQNMAQRFVRVTQEDSRLRDLKQLARDLAKNTRMNLWQLLQDRQSIVFLFCRQLRDFIFNTVWRNKGKDLGKLWKTIVDAQENLLATGYLPGDKLTDYWEKSREYKKIERDKNIAEMARNLWKAIQHVMDMLSDMFVYFDSHRPKTTVPAADVLIRTRMYFEELGRLDEVIQRQAEAMKTDGQTKSLEEYTRDQKRCTAILSDGTNRYLAFSGFLDAEDPDVRTFLGRTSDDAILDAFRQISGQLDASLVTIEADMLEEIYWYSINGSLDFVCRDNLKQEVEIRRTFPGANGGKLRHSYACCERKLLAYEKKYAMPSTGDLHLIVKFMPCMNCYAALLNWNKRNRLTVWYPEIAP